MDLSRPSSSPDRLAPPRVLLVEHPTALAASAAVALKAAGMDVEIAATQAEAMYLMDHFRPGVVLLHADAGRPAAADRMAPFVCGSACGVIVVLAENSEAARIESLDRGADDVLWAEGPVAELAARVRALHRRVERPVAAPAYEPYPPIMLDQGHRCLVGPQGERTPLSEAEFMALETLLDADGAPVSREWLGRVALKRLPHSEDRSVDQLVLKLRRKLAAVGASERTILSARRQGYVIADPSRFHTLPPGSATAEAAKTLAPVGD